MSWYEMNQQRRANRRKPEWTDGHRKRQGFYALLEKTSGDVVVVAKNGCFGRLAELKATRDEYDLWASGTKGAM
jgi:hypothetical protein